MIEIKGIPIWGDPIDPGALQQILNCSQDSRVLRATMMADHHKGYSVPIVGVLELDNAVSPSAVGYDIGCGNKAIKLKMVQDVDYDADGTPQPYDVKLIDSLEDIVMVELA